MSVDVSIIFKRFANKSERSIDCGQGWFSLLVELDRELSEIDPNYTVIQIKEKFGGLRYYYETKTSRGRLMNHVVRNYEKIASETCEISGKPGVLMSNGYVYKTLNIEHAPSGFKPVHEIRGANSIKNTREAR